MEALLQRKASYFEIYSFLASEALPNKTTLKIVLQYEHLQKELIALHYQRGMSLKSLAKHGVDIEPFRLREYVRVKTLLAARQFESIELSDLMITDGFLNETVTYFVFEELLATCDNAGLDVMLPSLNRERDLPRLWPLLRLMSEIPNEVVLYLRKYQIDTSTLNLTEEQRAFPERKSTPSNTDVLETFQTETLSQMYSYSELTEEGQTVLYVLVDAFSRSQPEKVGEILEIAYHVEPKLLTACFQRFIELNAEAISQGQYLSIVQQFISAGADSTSALEQFSSTTNADLLKILHPQQSNRCIC